MRTREFIFDINKIKDSLKNYIKEGCEYEKVLSHERMVLSGLNRLIFKSELRYKRFFN